MFNVSAWGSWWKKREERRKAKAEASTHLALPDSPKKNGACYQRTSGYRNWINQRGWLPVIKNGFAHLSQTHVYEIRNDGWRRIDQRGSHE